MTAGVEAARAEIARLESRRTAARESRVTLSQQLAVDDHARSQNATADVVGDDRTHAQLRDEDRMVLLDRLRACDAIEAFVGRQLPSARANLEAAEGEHRVAQGLHVRSEIVPPLFEAAQAAGAAFGLALARLAAAEDRAHELQRPQGEPYVPLNASRFLSDIMQTRADNPFFEIGAGRGAWDAPGYAEQTAEIDDQLREFTA